ncbi:helix-turn-helix transcriptional regulator [Desulfobotulus mexicanus]|uniref:Helix-turn-helix domain-containing protein n=1 Tax=Desulfobotulus mexicanus TaxID=2586642 RepID=A0A5Q4VD88_9BACT|nr:helix-turn-helix domain-containing protein [Desulfobotulus mexicanus]TYT75659.1 helix-turn-helix domain-containing protein [Desulfobotulus mexicanus]
MPKNVKTDAYMTRAEVAEHFGITAQSVSNLYRGGKLPPPLVLGRTCLRWPRHIIENFYQAQQSQSSH